MENIFVKFGKQETVYKFISKLFPIYSASLFKGCTTYKDEDCLIPQCSRERYRSIDDVYNCLKTYYPDITYKEMIYHLLTIKLKYMNKFYVLYPVVCSDINKNTICFSSENYKLKDKKFFLNRFHRFEQSSTSWVGLLSLLSITDPESFKNFRENNKYIIIDHDV